MRASAPRTFELERFFGHVPGIPARDSSIFGRSEDGGTPVTRANVQAGYPSLCALQLGQWLQRRRERP